MTDSPQAAPKHPNTQTPEHLNTPIVSPAFLWAGVGCLLAALVAFAITFVHRMPAGMSRLGLFDTGLLLVAGGALLIAHIRRRVWQEQGIEDSAPTPEHLNTQHPTPNTQHLTPNTQYELCALAGVTLLGIILRLAAMRHSLWYDELWTMGFMRSGPVYALTHQGSYNNHLLNSFLGSLLLHLRLLLTGLTPSTGAPAEWVRAPSFIFGACAAPMLYVAARDVIGRPAALAAAFLLAVSPPAIDLSAQTRGYAGVLFCGIAQAYFFARALRTAQPGAWVGWLTCAGVGVFSHLYMLFIVIANGLLVVILIGERLAKRRGRQAWLLLEQGVLLLTAWLAFTALCYSGVFYALRKEFGRVYENGPMAHAHDVIAPMLQLWGGLPTETMRPLLCGLAVLSLLMGLLFLARRCASLLVYLLALLIAPPVLVEILHPHFVYPRFFTFALPALLTLLACGLWQGVLLLAGVTAERRNLRFGLLALCTVGLVLPTLPGLRAVLLLPKQDYKQAGQALVTAQRAGQAVAVIGAGNEYFKTYGARPFYPQSVAQLIALTREHGALLVADTNITVNVHTAAPQTTQFVRRIAGPPVTIFPGRFATWPHRWLDGDSDIKLYLLRAEQLPEVKPRGTRGTRGRTDKEKGRVRQD